VHGKSGISVALPIPKTKGFPSRRTRKQVKVLKLFKILFGSELIEVGRMMNLGELRGLLLWVYFMGISTAWPRFGKPGGP
jgi:hypothetical protein